MDKVIEGFYGCTGDGATDEDFRLGGSLTLPKPRYTFEDLKVEYDQSKTRTPSTQMGCTILSNLGCLTDQTNHVFSEVEISDIVTKAIPKGFSITGGWDLMSATKHGVGWMKDNLGIDLTYFRINLISEDFWNAIDLGYSVQVGYRGNPEYMKDINKDGDLDLTTLVSTTYGHAIRSKSKDSIDFKIIDNYNKPSRKYNIYTIKRTNLKKLVENRVFFNYGYVICFTDDLFPSNIPACHTKDYEAGRKAVEAGRIANHSIDHKMTIAEIEADAKSLGIFTSQNGDIDWLRWCAFLRRVNKI